MLNVFAVLIIRPPQGVPGCYYMHTLKHTHIHSKPLAASRSAFKNEAFGMKTNTHKPSLKDKQSRIEQNVLK